MSKSKLNCADYRCKSCNATYRQGLKLLLLLESTPYCSPSSADTSRGHSSVRLRRGTQPCENRDFETEFFKAVTMLCRACLENLN